MTGRYFLTKLARDDLAGIRATIDEDRGHAAAVRVVERFRAAFALLAENPGVGHAREDLTDDPAVRFWGVHTYLVAYVHSGGPRGDVGIIRIIHGARDPEAIHRRWAGPPDR